MAIIRTIAKKKKKYRKKVLVLVKKVKQTEHWSQITALDSVQKKIYINLQALSLGTLNNLDNEKKSFNA